MHISAAFDSGNIRVIDATNPADVKLAIRKDAGDEHMQWFHFRVAGAKGVPCTLRLTNAHAASYAKAWSGYRAVCTSDRRSYHRVDTSYEDGALVIRHTPEADLVWDASCTHDRCATLTLDGAVALTLGFVDHETHYELVAATEP